MPDNNKDKLPGVRGGSPEERTEAQKAAQFKVGHAPLSYGINPEYQPELKTLAQVEKVFAKEFHLKKDWASVIAHACFVGNFDKIYQAFSKGLLKGDPKVFTALANRAYGLPQQELAFSQDKPFKLVIEYVGEEDKKPVIEGELGKTEESGE